MKKFFMFLLGIMMCLTISAKKPIIEQPFNPDVISKIEVVNDSTIIYYNVEGIQVAQPHDVYTGIFEYNPTSKKPMKLCIMNSGAYIWVPNDGKPRTYILYASKAFDRVVLRAKNND